MQINCPKCHRLLTTNNYKRHVDTCSVLGLHEQNDLSSLVAELGITGLSRYLLPLLFAALTLWTTSYTGFYELPLPAVKDFYTQQSINNLRTAL